MRLLVVLSALFCLQVSLASQDCRSCGNTITKKETGENVMPINVDVVDSLQECLTRTLGCRGYPGSSMTLFEWNNGNSGVSFGSVGDYVERVLQCSKGEWTLTENDYTEVINAVECTSVPTL
ncbi:hypothetical protein L596_014360 [Steinernema carpocapsae]|uniref:C6 domain-containing protein n=1 Tax=Steinernema carpocapsae TaxID=34508 RepID=A0A4U5NBP9_STECR|nr:hypothetical protein L596_014360 [Steinernema carpocapsae]